MIGAKAPGKTKRGHEGHRGHEGKTKIDKQLTTYCSRFPIPDSRFTIHDSRFPIPDSRFTIYDSRFTIYDSRNFEPPSSPRKTKDKKRSREARVTPEQTSR
jgi:hypothetical protein